RGVSIVSPECFVDSITESLSGCSTTRLGESLAQARNHQALRAGAVRIRNARMRVRMEAHNFFINKDGRLRSAWRITFFAIAFLVCAKLFEAVAGLAVSALHIPAGGSGDFLIGALILLSSATLVGWGCSVVFEELSFRAVGWWPHRGWWKNLLLGSVIGAASLLLAAALTAITRGIRFSFNPSGTASIGKTLIVSCVVFVLAGAGEE